MMEFRKLVGFICLRCLSTSDLKKRTCNSTLISLTSIFYKVEKCLF